MAYEALTNVLLQIGRGYENRQAEERRRDDIREERAYQDRVRDETFDRQLENNRELLKQNWEAEQQRLLSLPVLQLQAEAHAYGIPLTSVDGTPRPLEEVRDTLAQRRFAELTKATLQKRQAETAADADTNVIANITNAERARAEATLTAREEMAPRVQAVKAKENERLKEIAQTQLDFIAKELEPVMARIAEDPVAQLALQQAASLKGRLQAATPAMRKNFKPGQLEAIIESGDIAAMQSAAMSMGIVTDDDKAKAMALQGMRAEQQGLIAVALRSLDARDRILSADREGQLGLDYSSLKSFFGSAGPAGPSQSTAAASGTKLPGAGALPPPPAAAPASPSESGGYTGLMGLGNWLGNKMPAMPSAGTLLEKSVTAPFDGLNYLAGGMRRVDEGRAERARDINALSTAVKQPFIGVSEWWKRESDAARALGEQNSAAEQERLRRLRALEQDQLGSWLQYQQSREPSR